MFCTTKINQVYCLIISVSYLLFPGKVIGKRNKLANYTTSSTSISLLKEKKGEHRRKGILQALQNYKGVVAVIGFGITVLVALGISRIMRTERGANEPIGQQGNQVGGSRSSHEKSERVVDKTQQNNSSNNKNDAFEKKQTESTQNEQQNERKDDSKSFIASYPFLMPLKKVRKEDEDLYRFMGFLIQKIRDEQIEHIGEFETNYEALINEFTKGKKEQIANINESLNLLIERCPPFAMAHSPFKDQYKERMPKMILPLVLSGDIRLYNGYVDIYNKGYLHYLINRIWNRGNRYKSLLLESIEALKMEDRLAIFRKYIAYGGLMPLNITSKAYSEREEMHKKDALLFYLFYLQMGPITKKVMQRATQYLNKVGFASPGFTTYGITFLKDLFKSAQLSLTEDVVKKTFSQALANYKEKELVVTPISPIQYKVTVKEGEKDYMVSILGNASIAFVVLIEGDELSKPMVVKVGYPNIKEDLNREYEIIKNRLDESLLSYDSLETREQVGVITSIYTTAMKEVSFAEERKNILLFNEKKQEKSSFQPVQLHEKDGELEEVSRDKMLILEEALGETVLKTIHRCQKQVSHQLSKEEIQNLKNCLIGYVAYCTNRLLEEGIMHGDAHAGNLMIDLSKKLITEIDLGSIIVLEEEERTQFKKLLYTLISPKVEELIKAMKSVEEKKGEGLTFGTTKYLPEDCVMKIVQESLQDNLQYKVMHNMDEFSWSYIVKYFHTMQVASSSTHENYMRFCLEYALLQGYMEASDEHRYLKKLMTGWHIIYTMVDDWNKNYFEDNNYQQEAMGIMAYPSLSRALQELNSF